MIRRAPSSLPALSKAVKTVEVIGKSGVSPQVCFGYSQSDKGIKPCPAPAEEKAINVAALDLYAVSAHPSFGCNLIMLSTGDIIIWRTEDNLCFNFPKLPGGKPFSFETRDKDGAPLLAAVCGTGLCVCNKVEFGCGTVTTLPYSLYGGTMHCGRLFAADASDGYTVRWSGLGIDSWQDGIDGCGYVTLDGEAGRIIAVEEFGDDLLCVRERGFTLIHALADSRNFRIAPVQCAQIVEGGLNAGGTIGNKYYFTASDGLYSYDGINCKKEYGTEGVLTGFGKAYVLGDGAVYAECRYNGYRCLAKFNPATGVADFFGEDCTNPFYTGGRLICACHSLFKELTATRDDGLSLWRSGRIDTEGCERCANKVLKTLSVHGVEGLKIKVIADGAERTFDGGGQIPVNMRGRDFSIEVRGHGKAERVTAYFEVRK